MKKQLILDTSKLLGFKVAAKNNANKLTSTAKNNGKVSINDLMGAKVGKIDR